MVLKTLSIYCVQDVCWANLMITEPKNLSQIDYQNDEDCEFNNLALKDACWNQSFYKKVKIPKGNVPSML